MDFCLSKKEERTLWEIYKRGSGGMIVGDCSALAALAISIIEAFG